MVVEIGGVGGSCGERGEGILSLHSIKCTKPVCMPVWQDRDGGGIEHLFSGQAASA